MRDLHRHISHGQLSLKKLVSGGDKRGKAGF